MRKNPDLAVCIIRINPDLLLLAACLLLFNTVFEQFWTRGSSGKLRSMRNASQGTESNRNIIGVTNFQKKKNKSKIKAYIPVAAGEACEKKKNEQYFFAACRPSGKRRKRSFKKKSLKKLLCRLPLERHATKKEGAVSFCGVPLERQACLSVLLLL